MSAPRARGVWVGMALSLGALVLGCGEEPPPPATRGRGPMSGGRGAVIEPVAVPAAAPAGPSARSRRAGSAAVAPSPGRPLPSSASPEPSTASAEPAHESDVPAERDLGADLHALIPPIDGCLDLETARGIHGTLRVAVTAQVMPSGRVSSAHASSPALSRTQNACIEALVEHVSIRGPVDGAPRSISTTIELDVEITDPEEEPAATP